MRASGDSCDAVPAMSRWLDLTSLRAKVRRVAESPARWDLVAAALFTCIALVVYATIPVEYRPGSDGHYSWIYARSLAYDGDLDFTNDYKLCGDPFEIGWKTEANRPANIYYIGPAVFWTPAIALVKHFVHGPPEVVGGCTGPVPRAVLAMSCFAGGAVVFFTSALLRRWIGARSAALATLLLALCSPLLNHSSTVGSYSHVYDAMCVAGYLYVLVRARERDGPPRLLVVAGLLLGLAVLQRASNGILGLVAVAALGKASSTAALRRSAGSIGIVAACAFVFGLMPLLLANHAIYGRFVVDAHGARFFWPAHAHPLLLLFDERGGTFAVAPILWLAVPGLYPVWRRRDARWLVAPLLVCGASELWLSSAAMDWQAARRLLNLFPLGAFCLGVVVERVARFLRARPRVAELGACAAAVLAVACVSIATMYAYSRGKIPFDVPRTVAGRYGRGAEVGLEAVEKAIGPLDELPAAWVFALRYRLEPVAFGWAAQPQWYQRDHRSLEYYRSELPLSDGDVRQLLRGVRFDDGTPGACLRGEHAAAVFSLQWPVVTRVRLVYDADDDETLSVASRSFLGVRTPWESDVRLRAGKGQRVFLDVPAGGLDSGINEVLFERKATSSAGKLCLGTLEFVDDTRYAPIFGSDAAPPVHLWRPLQVRGDGAAAPSVAIGAAGGVPWMIEVHETPQGYLEGLTSPAGDFAGAAMSLGRGAHPALAADPSGSRVVEVHQGAATPGPLWCRAGRVQADGARVAVRWAEARLYGSGYHPAIALGTGGRLVEVEMSDSAGSVLSVRTATVADGDGGGITWNELRPLDGGGLNPAVAVAPDEGGTVVEVHQAQAAYGPLWMRVGRLGGDGSVAWGAARKYDDGVLPAIALYGSTILEVHQGQDGNGSLRIKMGTFGPDGTIAWHTTKPYDDGGHPALAVDPLSGRGVEIHEGRAGFGPLWAHDLDMSR